MTRQTTTGHEARPLPPLERLEDLDTPLVAVDLSRVERNISALQAYCDAHGLDNRPHIKTHKLPFVAHLQVRAGARGLTVQTLGEAETMVAAGLRDLLVTYDLVGEHKARRLARLALLADVRVAVDNDLALATVARAGELAGRPIGVLVEFESGKRRQGVLTPYAALALARAAHDSPFLESLGLMTYPSSPEVVGFVARARELFEADGVPLRVVSAGGTPRMWQAHELTGITEYRAGTSVYHDRKSLVDGSGTLDDVALHVHATVVSLPERDRAVIDAGSKVLTSDLLPTGREAGYGLVLEYPDALVAELSEEHAVLDLGACSERPALGERVRVVPNHVCPVSNLVDEVALHQGGTLLARLPVAARGKR
jgi:D-serine deaminase-like pyridoxal phosphate-dependent protein